MANFPRLTMFFQEDVLTGNGKFGVNQNYGMTETHWYQSTTADLQTVLDAGTTLAFSRAQMLGSNCYLTQIRASYDDVYRDSLVKAVPQPLVTVGNNNNNANQLLADVPYSDILVRAQSGTQYHKSIYLCGIPDGFIGVDGFQPNAVFYGYWANYKKNLINSWGWKAVNQDPVAVPAQPITAVSIAGGFVQFTIPGTTLQPGQKFSVRGITVMPNTQKLNGKYIVLSVGAGGVVTTYTVGTTNGYQGGGFAYLYSHTVVPYTDLQMGRPVERKRGGISIAPRGRRRKK